MQKREKREKNRALLEARKLLRKRRWKK